MISRTFSSTTIIVFLVLVLNVGLVFAGQVGGVPASRDYGVSSLSSVPVLDTEPLDVEALLQEDIFREEQGLPLRFALPENVDISPDTDGRWENLQDGSRLWRLRVANPGATSLNFGFSSFDLPRGANLFIYAADGSGKVLVFGAEDYRSHRQMWTPVFIADEVVVELFVPSGNSINEDNLTLGVVGCGYRDFGAQLDKAGACNIDVVCPEGDPWRKEIRAEARYTVDGGFLCSGSMINNAQKDGRPFMLTAYHCHITSSAAPSVVVYWNHQSENCGDLGGGTLDEFTTGSTLRASYDATDMTLIELDSYPDPAFGVTYAGWDRTDTVPSSAVAIHSPGGDEKCISFEHDQTSTATYLEDPSPGDGTHIRIESWDLGTTEGGSSGSPLFDPQHRIVGQLHGGYASCTQDLPDWYGRLAVSWEGGGSSATRLKDWLDPMGSGVFVLDTFDPADSVITPKGLIDILSSAPNPFNLQVTVTYHADEAGTVTGRVLNLHGALVADLGSRESVVGQNTWVWDGKSAQGQRLSSGLYILEINSSRHGDRTRVIYLH